MTIAIGMTCQDGVLIATDSMGSSGKIATDVQKAHALERHPIVWAVSGSGFMTQQVTGAIAKSERAKNARPTPEKIASSLRSVVRDAWKVPVVPPGGAEEDKEEHICEALVLGWGKEGPALLHLPPDLAPVDYSDRGFKAIGSGHEFAAVTREALSHHLDAQLPLHQALLVAYRLVSVVCRTSSWGIAPPVQIAIANDEGAQVLTLGDLEKLDTGVQRWLQSESGNFAGTNSDASGIAGLPSLRSAKSAPA